MVDNFLVHCGRKTRVADTRGVTRIRVCRVCGTRFKTEEIQVDFSLKKKRRKLLECPVSRNVLKRMMDEYPNLKVIANDLHVSTTVLNRWLREYDL